MDRTRAAKAAAVIVAASGALVMAGWFLEVEALKSLLPWMVTMKFTTALSFFLSGAALYFMAEGLSGRSTAAQAVLPAISLMIMLVMGTLLASAVLGVWTGVEDLLVEEEAEAVKTTVPGRPSLATMACFIAVAVASMASLFKGAFSGRTLFGAGVFMLATGAVALAGYALGLEYLYYSWPGVSTAMALSTAFLFVVLGLGVVVLSGVAR